MHRGTHTRTHQAEAQCASKRIHCQATPDANASTPTQQHTAAPHGPPFLVTTNVGRSTGNRGLCTQRTIYVRHTQTTCTSEVGPMETITQHSVARWMGAGREACCSMQTSNSNSSQSSVGGLWRNGQVHPMQFLRILHHLPTDILYSAVACELTLSK